MRVLAKDSCLCSAASPSSTQGRENCPLPPHECKLPEQAAGGNATAQEAVDSVLGSSTEEPPETPVTVVL